MGRCELRRSDVTRHWDVEADDRRGAGARRAQDQAFTQDGAAAIGCVAALRAHRIAQAQERLAQGERWQDLDYVFTTAIGTPSDPRNLTRQFAAACKRAKLPASRFHNLRHTCASLLLAQGVQPRVIMETLGHSCISITMDLYTHVMPSQQREAADRMQSLLG